MKSIFDRSFEYVPAEKTDLRKVFARVRNELREQEEARARAKAETSSKVSLIGRGKSAAA